MARYLKQVIVVNKSLSMPTGKIATMVAHASMSFILASLKSTELEHGQVGCDFICSDDEARWLTELDPGIESSKQVSMAKIVCQVNDEDELLAVERHAKASGLTVHRVIDSGHSHNKPGTLTCIAIGPHWPEQLEPVTGGLKVYR